MKPDTRTAAFIVVWRNFPLRFHRQIGAVFSCVNLADATRFNSEWEAAVATEAWHLKPADCKIAEFVP